MTNSLLKPAAHPVCLTKDAGLCAEFSFSNLWRRGCISSIPALQQKAARLCFGLVRYHPFVDGNKRIGAHAMLVFLALNGIELQHSQTELSNVILQLASGD